MKTFKQYFKENNLNDASEEEQISYLKGRPQAIQFIDSPSFNVKK